MNSLYKRHIVQFAMFEELVAHPTTPARAPSRRFQQLATAEADCWSFKFCCTTQLNTDAAFARWAARIVGLRKSRALLHREAVEKANRLEMKKRLDRIRRAVWPDDGCSSDEWSD
jgi:hypothetical protein